MKVLCQLYIHTTRFSQDVYSIQVSKCRSNVSVVIFRKLEHKAYVYNNVHTDTDDSRDIHEWVVANETTAHYLKNE
jgi:hypothetical protein